MEVLSFIYRNTAGESRRRDLSQWTEVGHYITGFSSGDNSIRTFRKDRITEYLDGSANHLTSPFENAPPRLAKERPADQQPQILFTGFPAALRAELEKQCVASGLQVCKTVTKFLSYLCIGPNAGPAKVEKSRTQNVYIVNAEQLRLLLETGELPDIESP